jgi:copper resistance protein D
VALLAVVALIGAGIYVAKAYVESWQGLVGSGYGAMILSKIILLSLALALAAWNYTQLKQWKSQQHARGIYEKLPLLLRAEAWVLAVALLGAAALTALPPAIDTAEQQATFAEVVEHFTPKAPRLVPPAREDYLANAPSVFENYVLSGVSVRAQSEFNHNFAGALVLIMALLALIDRNQHALWARHWPLLFLGLAVFLLLFAEPNVWPLGPEGFWETLREPTVLQHRLATLVVIGLGLFEWRVRIGKPLHPQAAYAFPLLCLIGGALLLTHSHSGFVLKSAFLIEAHHGILGVLAVIMGIGRRLELGLNATEGDWMGWVWRASFVCVGLLLLFYREPVNT